MGCLLRVEYDVGRLVVMGWRAVCLVSVSQNVIAIVEIGDSIAVFVVVAQTVGSSLSHQTLSVALVEVEEAFAEVRYSRP